MAMITKRRRGRKTYGLLVWVELFAAMVPEGRAALGVSVSEKTTTVVP
jgi:hypothetical protein